MESGREGMGILTFLALEVHKRVMEDVVKGVRGDWLEQGVDVLVIDELRDLWSRRLAAVHETPEPEPEAILFGAGAAPPPLPPGRPVPKQAQSGAPEEPSEKKQKIKEEKLEGEESLSSLDSDEDLVHVPAAEDEAEEESNVVLAQWEQVKSSTTTSKGVNAGKFTAKLRLGLASLDGQDYVFKSGEAHLKRW